MTVKDLILRQNKDKIIEYMKENFIPDYEDKEKISKIMEKGFSLSLADIANIVPKISDEDLVFAFPYKETDGNCNIEINVDISNIKKSELLNMDTDYEIQTRDDVMDKKYPIPYSFMFIDWETILGYKIIEESFEHVSELEFACKLLYELTWFGYTKEIATENTEKEIEELDRRMEEAEKGKTYAIEDVDEWFFNLSKEAGLYDGMTDEEIEEERREDKIRREKDLELFYELNVENKRKEFEFLKKVKKTIEKEASLN